MLKRYTLPLISALVVSASLASCQRKEVASVPELPPAGEIGFTVSDSDAETKSTPLETNYFSGEEHNSFNVVVYKHAAGAATSAWELFSDKTTCEYNSAYGLWKPSTAINWPMTEDKLTFIAYAPSSLPSPTTSSDAALVDGEAPFLKNFTVDSDVNDQEDILLASKESSASPLVGNLNVGLEFRHALTFVKFSIGVNTTCSRIKLSGIPRTGNLDMSTGAWSSVRDTVSYIIDPPTFGDPDANGQRPIADSLTLMLIPQTLPADAKLTAETSAGRITASLAGQVWEPGKVVTYKLTDPVISFSVSSSGDKVRFSPGNLQAVFAAAGSTFTWKFADNQWDVVGNKEANTSIDVNGSVSAAGTVDLFGWSTAATTYGIHNSTEKSTYSGDFVDWGSDPRLVSTLGSGWRTLTSDEWGYLLDTRDNDNNDLTLYPRYCKATVNDVPGLVIFPDGFYDLSVYFNINGVNTSGADFDTNSWSGDVWTKMEDAGCVFLPAAGLRTNSSAVSGVYTNGFYWSSTLAEDNKAYIANIAVTPLYGGSAGRHVGSSVRLVQDL